MRKYPALWYGFNPTKKHPELGRWCWNERNQLITNLDTIPEHATNVRGQRLPNFLLDGYAVWKGKLQVNGVCIGSSLFFTPPTLWNEEVDGWSTLRWNRYGKKEQVKLFLDQTGQYYCPPERICDNCSRLWGTYPLYQDYYLCPVCFFNIYAKVRLRTTSNIDTNTINIAHCLRNSISRDEAVRRNLPF